MPGEEGQAKARGESLAPVFVLRVRCIPSHEHSGTGQFVVLCRQSGVPVEIINPLKLSA